MSSSTETASTSPSERRRSHQRAEARRLILGATQALLVEDGYEAFSMRRLAARCGYTAPTIYHYFGDKQQLLDEVFERRFRQVVARLRGVRPSPDPADTVRAMLLDLLRFGLANPDHARLLSVPRPEGTPPPPSAEQARRLFLEPLGLLAAEGRLLAADVEEAEQFVWVTTNGLLSLRIQRGEGFGWSPTLLDFSVDAVIRGIAAPVAEGGRS